MPRVAPALPDAAVGSRCRAKRWAGPARDSASVDTASVITVIIPAHNEAQVLGRLLRQLVADADAGELDVIVVANGCTDDTAAIAASWAPVVRVISTPKPSKYEALKVGDAAARDFPRIYVDADVELTTSDIRALGDALNIDSVLAAGPQREIALADRPWPIRWYYDVWTQLPEVQDGLFGRGVIGVSAAGHARLEALPPLLSDDLAWSLAFEPGERTVVQQARVLIHPPRTVGDLLRRRIRAATGVAQIDAVDEAPRTTARTQPSHLMKLVRERPSEAPHVLLFLSIALTARWFSRRRTRNHDYSTWLRDESSRS